MDFRASTSACLALFAISSFTVAQSTSTSGSATDAYPSAFLFKGVGQVGSFIAAEGCDITYALTCTDTNVCSSNVIETVTQSAGPIAAAKHDYAMSYISTGSANGSGTLESVYESCELYGTTVAYCHATAIVALNTLSITSASSFSLNQGTDLGYAYVTMTAGPVSARHALKTCSTHAPQSSSSASTSEVGGASGFSSSGTRSTSNATNTAARGTGLSTGAKAGIGAGVGIAALALLVLGVFVLFRRRRNRPQKLATFETPRPVEKIDDGSTGPYEVEQPAVKHEMPVGKEAQEMPDAGKGISSRHELSAGKDA